MPKAIAGLELWLSCVTNLCSLTKLHQGLISLYHTSNNKAPLAIIGEWGDNLVRGDP